MVKLFRLYFLCIVAAVFMFSKQGFGTETPCLIIFAQSNPVPENSVQLADQYKAVLDRIRGEGVELPFDEEQVMAQLQTKLALSTNLKRLGTNETLSLFEASNETMAEIEKTICDLGEPTPTRIVRKPSGPTTSDIVRGAAKAAVHGVTRNTVRHVATQGGRMCARCIPGLGLLLLGMDAYGAIKGLDGIAKSAMAAKKRTEYASGQYEAEQVEDFYSSLSHPDAPLHLIAYTTSNRGNVANQLFYRSNYLCPH